MQCGGKTYEQQRKGMIASKLGLQPTDLTLVGTAADMDNLAVVTKTFRPFVVTALVTGGAKTNAQRTGLDEGTYIEGEEPKGTINILVLTNARLTDGAMARALITITEAKTAAFEDLQDDRAATPKVSRQPEPARTVSSCRPARRGPKVTYTGGHNRIGELIGKAVYEAVIEALGKQNGFKKEM